MAPLSPSNTPRYNLFYSVSGGLQHSMQIRAPATVSPAAIGSFYSGLFTALSANLYAVTVDFVHWAPAGSDIFNPVTTGIEGTGFGGGVQPAVNGPLQISFVGRSPAGRRGRVFAFGWKAIDPSWRFTAGENIEVDAAVAVLVGAAGYPVGIDGSELVWKSYANVGYNDHYVKELRA